MGFKKTFWHFFTLLPFIKGMAFLFSFCHRPFEFLSLPVYTKIALITIWKQKKMPSQKCMQYNSRGVCIKLVVT